MTTEPALRRDALWCELAFVDEIDPTDDGRRRFHSVTYDGIVDNLSEADRQWLLEDLADENQPGRRPVALHALIDLWVWNGRCSSDLIEIGASLKGDQELGQVLDKQTAPPKRDERSDELDRKYQERKRADDVREDRHLEDRKSWRRKLITDPAQWFSG